MRHHIGSNGGCKPMSMRNARRLIAIAVLSMVPLELGCVQQATRDCKKVEINSAGVYCFDSARLVGVAPGSGGLDGAANYVRISPPSILGESFEDVSRIVLIADVSPAPEPKCQAGNDEGSVRCAISIPGRMLMAIVTFRATRKNRFEERTKIVASDAAQNVIKEWPREPQVK